MSNLTKHATAVVAGIDIGGTKCAVTLGRLADDGVVILAKRRFATLLGAQATLARLVDDLRALLTESGLTAPAAIGVSCGGPLDSRRGLILSPPNLPGWDAVDVVTPFRQRFDAPTVLQNDANAGALAEWRGAPGAAAAA